ncbi:hypothetical protein [Microbulbifer sp.]
MKINRFIHNICKYKQQVHGVEAGGALQWVGDAGQEAGRPLSLSTEIK